MQYFSFYNHFKTSCKFNLKVEKPIENFDHLFLQRINTLYSCTKRRHTVSSIFANINKNEFVYAKLWRRYDMTTKVYFSFIAAD